MAIFRVGIKDVKTSTRRDTLVHTNAHQCVPMGCTGAPEYGSVYCTLLQWAIQNAPDFAPSAISVHLLFKASSAGAMQSECCVKWITSSHLNSHSKRYFPLERK